MSGRKLLDPTAYIFFVDIRTTGCPLSNKIILTVPLYPPSRQQVH